MRHPVSALFSATWIFTAMMIGRGVTHAQTPAATHAFPVRTWTSINGNTADGTFQREANGRIYFKHVNGMSIAINRDRLAPDDLAWVDAQVQRAAAQANPGSAPEIAAFPALTANEMQRLPNYNLKVVFVSPSVNSLAESSSRVSLLRVTSLVESLLA